MSTPSEQNTYDKIYVGGGIASVAWAYFAARTAKEHGKPFKALLIADEIHAPTSFGSILIPGLEGCDHGGLVKKPVAVLKVIREMFNRLPKILEEEEISCGFALGYQMFGMSKTDLASAKKVLLNDWHFAANEILSVPKKEEAPFTGVKATLSLTPAGQINMPQFLQGLLTAFERMGGAVLTGERYISQVENADGSVSVKTASGKEFAALRPPSLATGAEHMSNWNDLFPTPVTPVYTPALHVQLSEEHARIISPGGARVFCDTSPQDVIWAGVDANNVLTFGAGESDRKEDFGRMKANLLDQFYKFLPFLGNTYDDKMEYSFGAMSMTDNGLPIIRRFDHMEVMTGFCSIGILPALAAADAFARADLGDDKDLLLFEDLNPLPGRHHVPQELHVPVPSSLS